MKQRIDTNMVPPDQAILEEIQTLSVKVLKASAQGEIDLNQLALRELASRGLNREGQWVGFEKAKEQILN